MQRRGDFLKEKADRFFETALHLYSKEYYDLSAFNLEQAIQLHFKYTLWQKLGDYPKIHSLFELFEALKEAIPEKQKEIQLLIEKNKEMINDLELAYLESRYFPVRFFKEQIERMINFVKCTKEFLDRL